MSTWYRENGREVSTREVLSLRLTASTNQLTMAVPRRRHEAIRVAKRLNKFIPLPHLRRWKVHSADVLHSGRVLSLLRTKNVFFADDLSSLKMRMATVTKLGYLVLYETPDKGLIINLREATHILTECDKYKSKKVKYSRSHIKIRMPRGNVHLYVRDDDIPKWTSALLEAHVNSEHKISSMENEELMEEQTAIEDVDDVVPETSSNSGLVTVVEQQSSEESQLPSIRRGTIPVKSIREKIESKIVNSKKTAAPNEVLSSLFVLHNGKPEELEEEEEPNGSEKKEWWMRSLRC